jgi:AhpD family alkylhydroperoxidase
VAAVNIGKQYPQAYQSLQALNQQAAAAATAAGLDPRLAELIKIRASQLNGCAFCLRMHTRDALAAGESSDRLAVLAAWWESQYFAPTERAALALTEQLTLINDPGGIPERGVDPVEVLTPEQYAATSWLAIVINAWNRVAVFSHYPVGP